MKEDNNSNNKIVDRKIDTINMVIDDMMDDESVSYLAIVVKQSQDGDLSYTLYYNNILEALTLAEIAAEQIEKRL